MARLPYVIPYDPDFLGDGYNVPLPTPQCQGKLYQFGAAIDYIHASLVLHQDRRIALYTAHNIDASKRRSVPRTGWGLDPRVPSSAQTGASAYANNDWDRGHLVRRAAVAWGDTEARAQAASDATFYYTNAAPQHKNFNQEEWVALEDWVLQSAAGVSPRLCVFTGPIYTTNDVVDAGVRIPSVFWKVVVLRDPTAAGNDLAALGFVMKQNELWTEWNGGEMADFETFQVGIAEIGGYAGLSFGAIGQLDEFEWRQVCFRDRGRMRPVRIAGPGDIEFFGPRRRKRGIRALRVATHDGPEPVELGPTPCPSCNGDVADPGTDKDRFEALTRHVDALRELVDNLLLAPDKDCSKAEREAIRDRAVQEFGRIVGGNIVGTTEFPDCACIGEGEAWFCSGVLIHPRVVVTAAHCAPGIDRVYLGSRSLTLLETHGEVVEVATVHVHPDYEPGLAPAHDIAVLVLEEDATVAPARLATTAQVDADSELTLVGFGYDHPTQSIGFGTKRKVNVPMTTFDGLSAAEVTDLETTHGFDRTFEIHAGRKGLGKDSCNGDSGGPAYINTAGDEFLLAGITSRASFSADVRCGSGGIYTRVAPYVAWIEGIVGDLDVGVDAGDPVEPPSTDTCVYISAAMPNPAGPDAGSEWIEVTNGGGNAATLAGLTLADKQGGEVELSGALAIGATRRVVLPANSPIKLANAGDEIVLLRGADELHRVGYAGAGKGEVISFDNPCPPAGGGCGGAGGGGSHLPDADPC